MAIAEAMPGRVEDWSVCARGESGGATTRIAGTRGARRISAEGVSAGAALGESVHPPAVGDRLGKAPSIWPSELCDVGFWVDRGRSTVAASI